MAWKSDVEARFTTWSAFIIGGGLLLIAVQLGVQAFSQYRCLSELDKCANKAVLTVPPSYIGLAVVSIGAALLGWVSLTSRWRFSNAAAVETGVTELKDHVAELKTEVANLQRDITAMNTGVTALQASVAAMNRPAPVRKKNTARLS